MTSHVIRYILDENRFFTGTTQEETLDQFAKVLKKY
jgi:hypothetical protein